MEHAQKMMLIPAETFQKIHDIQNNNVMENGISSLDKEMTEILNSKLDDYSKWIKYEQILNRYLHLIKKHNEPLTIPIIENNENKKINEAESTDTKEDHNKPYGYYNFENIAKTLPKSDQEKARLFIKKMEDSNISWNKLGMITIDGKSYIENSNIVDLVNDFVRKRKKPSSKTYWGSEELLYALKKINIPTELIGNMYYKDILLSNKILNSPQTTPSKIKEDAKFVWKSLPV